jgi:hypothetical protein
VSIKKKFASMALAALAVAAMAPQAMAATPEVHPVKGEFPVEGLSTFGAVTITTTPVFVSISCTSGIGTYDVTSKTTAEKAVLLHGCKSTSSGATCFSAGQPTGTITLAPSVSHLVYLDENHTKPGILTTPPASGVFSIITCGGGTKYELKGSGMLAEITAPQCGSTSSKSTVVAETSTPGTQKYLQVEETGSVYDLSFFSGFVTAAISGTETITAERELTLTCPEQHE